MRRAIVACLALAFLSLLLPSEPSYDPWAWIVWGREIFDLDLDTTGGPSWKPGPVLFTTLFAPFGEIDDGLPPALWLVVARAAGLLALVLAYRVGRRLGGSAVAGVVAAVALATLPLWLRYLAHGNEAPMAVALMLGAVERELDGRRDHAAILLFAACLLRPEVFPFLAVPAVLLWRAQPEHRRLVASLFLALPVLWLVPEWIGSGNPLDAGKQASSSPPWSLANAQVPWIAGLERAHTLCGIELEIAAMLGLFSAAIRRQRATLVLAGIGIAWLLLVAGMTQFGFSGAARYFLPPLVVACLLAGVGVANALAVPAPRAARLAVAAALVALAVTFGIDRGGDLGEQARSAGKLVQKEEKVKARIERRGGPLRRLHRAFHTFAAWETGRPIREIEQALDTTYAGPAKAL
jgi:hypothetical protein